MGATRITLGFIILTLVGCTGPTRDTGSAMTKDEARASGGKSDGGKDFCAQYHWYGDGECDDFCANPDPDCAAECPLTGVVCDPSCPADGRLNGAPCRKGTFDQTTCECLAEDACAAAGGTCKSSPMDVAFPANCEQDYGMATVDAECAAMNQTCCAESDCPPTGVMCTPDCGDDGRTPGGAPCHRGTFNPTTCECEAPRSCGGLAGMLCPVGRYCDYTIDQACGAADQMGTCRIPPDACTEQYEPVCGCNGQTYGNACLANAAGTSVASEGPCAQADCRDSGCPDGQECQLCWAHWSCVPDGAMC